MKVASKDLSQKLWNLSKWTDTDYRWYNDKGVDYVDVKGTNGLSLPAYDLGYLLRKLPPFVDSKEYPNLPAYLNIGLRDNGPPWFVGYHVHGIEDVVSDFGERGDTVENAACEMAITLFEAGILTKYGGVQDE